MRHKFIDFRQVDEIDAEAIGPPGRRVFRIRIRKGSDTASLWLEKQQLQALYLSIRQVLSQDPSGSASADTTTLPIANFPQEASLDFHIGRLAVGWDEDAHEIVLEAHSLEDSEDLPSAFRCRIRRDQAITFSQQAAVVCAAGRPVCFLCGEPIEPTGHVCVRSNGHLDPT